MIRINFIAGIIRATLISTVMQNWNIGEINMEIKSIEKHCCGHGYLLYQAIDTILKITLPTADKSDENVFLKGSTFLMKTTRLCIIHYNIFYIHIS